MAAVRTTWISPGTAIGARAPLRHAVATAPSADVYDELLSARAFADTLLGRARLPQGGPDREILLLTGKYQEAAETTRRLIDTAYRPRSRAPGDQPTNYARTLLILALAAAGLGETDEAAAAAPPHWNAAGSSGRRWCSPKARPVARANLARRPARR